MDKPNTISAEEWARYNEHVARRCLAAMDLGPYEVEVVELPPAIQDLTLAVNRAASDLQGGGERENRIALQLLTALARFASETGT